MEQKIDKAAREYRVKKNLAVGTGDNQSFLCPFKAFEDAFKAGADYALSNQWRSGRGELPEYGETVLIMTDDSEYPVFGEWYGDYWEIEIGDIISRSYDADYPFKVLAWMPIPALPQERKEGEP